MTAFEISALVVLALACSAIVASLWVLRRKPVNPDQMDVNELALEVAKLGKQVRRDRMRAVRAGEGEPTGAPLDGPPELREAPQPASPDAGARVTKEELRRRVFSRGR